MINSEYQIRKYLNIKNNSVDIYIIIGKNIYYDDGHNYHIEAAYLNKKQANEYLKKYDDICIRNDVMLYIDKVKIAIRMSGELYILSNNNSFCDIQHILTILEEEA